MAKKPKLKQYKVTTVVYVDAQSPRHAAHIASGVAQSQEHPLNLFTVEETTASWTVDLDKGADEPGYAVLTFPVK
jgi:hypothetical protein